ncbi:hypothetical protein BAUCODRAFT_29937, partial [Baudoinia panamericana UAMH 10762]
MTVKGPKSSPDAAIHHQRPRQHLPDITPSSLMSTCPTLRSDHSFRAVGTL